MIDQSMDPLLPELQTAFTLDERAVSKIVGYETAMDGDEEEDGRWLSDLLSCERTRRSSRQRVDAIDRPVTSP
jgi:hypothetical protein